MTTTGPGQLDERRASVHTWHSSRGDHRFFSIMAVAMATTIVAGFGSTYGPKVVTGEPALPAIIHLHAGVFTSWLVLFVAQASLVYVGRIRVHRRLGVAVVGVAALMLPLGIATAITTARQGRRGIPGVEFADPEGFLLLNVLSVVVFALLVAAGWYFRRDLQTHKRLMLMATAGALVGPGVSRLPVASGRPGVIAALVMAFVFAGPVYDFVTRRRVHRAYLWAVPLAVTIFPPVVAVLSATSAWRALAAALLR